MQSVPAAFIAAASDPLGYAEEWKRRTGRPVVGTFPMHFPAEVAHAAGALTMVVQASKEAVTVGGGSFYPFFCGYTRSVVDQATKGRLDFLDAVVFGDHCVQMLSAADVVRVRRPQLHVGFHQLVPALRDNWSLPNAERTLRNCVADLEEQLGVEVSDDAIRESIALYNRGRRAVRELYELRRSGQVDLTGRQLQDIVKSSMVMDRQEHTALLEDFCAQMRDAAGRTSDRRVPVYVSGHLCHAPKPEILDLIEDCGAVIADDDLYTGFRYVSCDVEETGDPVQALARWYIERNEVVPCPTRLDPSTDWDGFLLDAVRRSGARGLIVLLVKFCEPHYFYYPRIKATFESHQVPHLLIETEHETNAAGNMRTRIEALVELIRRTERPAREEVRP
ncbi:MAG TPA: 2-hydroxyacyl-CoA dehydratase family protein [Sporichthyaceae bacterium]|jgi:bcr-type benzoyl-CoA reductase subunit C|nr:2-hydroxyacyl-CoA dehydratase family protein [Sporichthyaceae bacterium]